MILWFRWRKDMQLCYWQQSRFLSCLDLAFRKLDFPAVLFNDAKRYSFHLRAPSRRYRYGTLSVRAFASSCKNHTWRSYHQSLYNMLFSILLSMFNSIVGYQVYKEPHRCVPWPRTKWKSWYKYPAMDTRKAENFGQNFFAHRNSSTTSLVPPSRVVLQKLHTHSTLQHR